MGYAIVNNQRQTVAVDKTEVHDRQFVAQELEWRGEAARAVFSDNNVGVTRIHAVRRQAGAAANPRHSG